MPHQGLEHPVPIDRCDPEGRTTDEPVLEDDVADHLELRPMAEPRSTTVIRAQWRQLGVVDDQPALGSPPPLVEDVGDLLQCASHVDLLLLGVGVPAAGLRTATGTGQAGEGTGLNVVAVIGVPR